MNVQKQPPGASGEGGAGGGGGVLYENVFLEIPQNSQENICARNVFK